MDSEPSIGRLSSPSVIRALLDSLGHRPNKGLGQNYLVDANILGRIIDAADIVQEDQLLEIGPGLGALTQVLLASGAPLTAIEKDPTMAAHLRKTFPNLNLIEDDVLNVDLNELFRQGINKVVANLPYAVGSRFVVNVLETDTLPDRMVYMVQKEVADRMTAPFGSKAYGPLAIWSQLNYSVSTVKKVSPNCFMPPPKVWSAVVKFDKREVPLAEVTDRARFKRLVKQAFTQRRKQIGSILRKMMPEFLSGLDAAGIAPETRPEQISIEQWVSLAETPGSI
jgi:16S rRNA (adenine1518-N6/adenine1519-N6)-dimethyltransferase